MQPLPQEALNRSPTLEDVGGKMKERRVGGRPPPGGFRPQTLPLWECVGAHRAPEQNN